LYHVKSRASAAYLIRIVSDPVLAARRAPAGHGRAQRSFSPSDEVRQRVVDSLRAREAEGGDALQQLLDRARAEAAVEANGLPLPEREGAGPGTLGHALPAPEHAEERQALDACRGFEPDLAAVEDPIRGRRRGREEAEREEEARCRGQG